MSTASSVGVLALSADEGELCRSAEFQAGDASFFLARETIIPSPVDGMVAWREHLFALMHRNATRAAQYFRLPARDVIELGIQVEI